MQTHRFKINKRNGSIEFLNPPPFKAAVDTRKRFSEIVPSNRLLRTLFRTLRFTFGERGAVAVWTRHWSCRWKMEILQGPQKGYKQWSEDRLELIDKEREIWFTPKIDI